jgi:hypothetical protein
VAAVSGHKGGIVDYDVWKLPDYKYVGQVDVQGLSYQEAHQKLVETVEKQIKTEGLTIMIS